MKATEPEDLISRPQVEVKMQNMKTTPKHGTKDLADCGSQLLFPIKIDAYFRRVCTWCSEHSMNFLCTISTETTLSLELQSPQPRRSPIH